MILLDTHTWVWWCSSPNKLSVHAKRAIQKDKNRILCDISLWEIAMLVAHRRLNLDRDLEEWFEDAIVETQVDVHPISPRIAYRSQMLGEHFHGDPADRLIVATAIEMACPLVTVDEKIHQYQGVFTTW